MFLQSLFKGFKVVVKFVVQRNTFKHRTNWRFQVEEQKWLFSFIEVFQKCLDNFGGGEICTVNVSAVDDNRYLRFESLFVDEIPDVVNRREDETSIGCKEKIFDTLARSLLGKKI